MFFAGVAVLVASKSCTSESDSDVCFITDTAADLLCLLNLVTTDIRVARWVLSKYMRPVVRIAALR